MTLEQKAGQVFTFGFFGSIPNPDVIRSVTELYGGGLRLTTWERDTVAYEKPGSHRAFSRRKLRKRYIPPPYLTPREYAGILNDLQDLAMARKPAVPLHYSIDQEGGIYGDYLRGGVNFFPSNMGYTAMNDPELAHRCLRAVARQLRALGIHFVHSPVLDVNVNPDNPEIGTRSFSDDPAVVTDMAEVLIRAFDEEGICAVAKHFPGRGRSATDAHYGIPRYDDADRQAMEDVDVYPYRQLISRGALKSIMTAHTIYPPLGDDDLVATLSPVVVGEFLRRELAFDGIIATDSMTMHGIVDRFGIGEACAMAIAAGADLVLMKGPRSMQIESVETVRKWVEDGRLKEERLDEALTRVLTFKQQRGLFQDPKMPPDKVERPLRDREIIELSCEASRKSAMLLKNKNGLIPISREKNILLIEQVSQHVLKTNDRWFHPGQLREYFAAYADHLETVETDFLADDEDIELVEEKQDWADIIVLLHCYMRGEPANEDFLQRLLQTGKPVVVITNSPYEAMRVKEADAVLLNFLCITAGLKASTEILFGESSAGGTWPLKHFLWDG